MVRGQFECNTHSEFIRLKNHIRHFQQTYKIEVSDTRQTIKRAFLRCWIIPETKVNWVAFFTHSTTINNTDIPFIKEMLQNISLIEPDNPHYPIIGFFYAEGPHHLECWTPCLGNLITSTKKITRTDKCYGQAALFRSLIHTRIKLPLQKLDIPSSAH